MSSLPPVPVSPIPVICLACTRTASVNKVTSGLRCVCGSTDLDLYTGSDDQRELIATARRATAVDPLKGWSEYEGPMPGPNPMSNGVVTPLTCPTCHGSTIDPQEGKCRLCGAQGQYKGSTEDPPPPQVARHQYPSNQTTTPFVGRRRRAGRTTTDPLGSPEQHIRDTTPDYSPQGPRQPRDPEFDWGNTDSHYPKADTRSPAVSYGLPYDYAQPGAAPLSMPGTQCPGCGKGPMHLQKDQSENAWMACPTCGPLADIDKNPDIDPYKLPKDFTPAPDGYKATRRFLGGRKTGRLIRAIGVIARTNPGLTAPEVIFFARQAQARYPEPR